MHYSDRALYDARRIANTLKRRIHEAGLTYRDVEARLGMGQKYLGQLLRGGVDLKVKQLTAVLAAIDAPLEDFFADALGLAYREKTLADLPTPESARRTRLATLRDLIWILEERGVLTHEQVERLLAVLRQEEESL
jgi:transcriptional regulator with XRE-family HTH domain